MTFDRPTVRLIQSEINEALKKIAEKNKIGLTVEGASFTHNSIRFKVTATSDAVSPYEMHYKEHEDFIVKSYGIPKGSLGKVINLGRHQYILAGYNPRATKSPFVGRRNDRDYVLSPYDVRIGLTVKVDSNLRLGKRTGRF